MMKKAIALATLALAATQSIAAEQTWYVGGDIASSKFTAFGDSERKTGAGVYGGYRLHENFAVEATVRNMGNWDTTSGKLSANSLSVSALAIAPLADQFALFARLGYARNSLDLSKNGGTISVHENKSLYGIGGDFYVNKHLTVRAEFVNLGKNHIGSGVNAFDISIKQVNAGASYAF